MSGIKSLVESMRKEISNSLKSKKEKLGDIGNSDDLSNYLTKKTPPIADQIYRAKSLYGPENDDVFSKEVQASIDHYFDAKKNKKSVFDGMTEDEEVARGLQRRRSVPLNTTKEQIGKRRQDLYREITQIIESNTPLYMIDYKDEEERQQMLDDARKYFKNLFLTGSREPEGKTMKSKKESWDSIEKPKSDRWDEVK